MNKVRVPKRFDITVEHEKVLVTFHLVYPDRPNVYPSSIEVSWHFEPDGDVDDEGRGIDCSRWIATIKNEGADQLREFFESAYGKIDFSDFKPEYDGHYDDWHVDMDHAKAEITERINEALSEVSCTSVAK